MDGSKVERVWGGDGDGAVVAVGGEYIFGGVGSASAVGGVVRRGGGLRGRERRGS